MVNSSLSPNKTKLLSLFSLAALLLILLFFPLSPTNRILLLAGAPPSVQTFLSSPQSLPEQTNEAIPEISARAAIVVDPDSWTVLFERNAEKKLPIASLTKLMTALVALDNFSLNREIYISQLEDSGSQMGLKVGETVTGETLLWGLLLNSGNDAAAALARAYPGGTTAFVEKMNQKAQELNLKNTHFKNPIGWHEPEHYSTARDLALLTRHFLHQPLLAQIVATPTKTVTSVPKKRSTCSCSGNANDTTFSQRWYHLQNTHPLLGELNGGKGVKTGYIPEAGECLISYVERNEQKLIIILLNSGDRVGETKAVVKWLMKS